MPLHRHRKGFTLIELLIIIVIIGILASIGIVAYNGHRTRAKTNIVIDDLNKIEDALNLYVDKKQLTSWPVDESSAGGIKNTAITQFIQTSGLESILPSSPNNPLPDGWTWEYDYDNDSKTACGGSGGVNARGVNITIVGIPRDTAQIVDSSIDDGDLNCGKVRYSDAGETKMYYMISSDGVVR